MKTWLLSRFFLAVLWLAKHLMPLLILLCGCHGNYGTQPAVPYTPAAAGAAQPFDVLIYNGEQWPLVVTVNGTPAQLVPIGTTLDVFYGNLPGSVTVDVSFEMGGGVLYPLPGRTASLGRDYGPRDVQVIFNYP